MPRNTLAARLRQMVVASGVTISDLATLSKVSRSNFHFVLADTRDTISASTLEKLCNVFGVSMAWLYCGEGDAPKPEDVRAHVEKVMRAPSKRKRTGTEG